MEEMLNDPDILPDPPPRPHEVIHRNRSRIVSTLFGRITLRHSYYFHTMAHQSRYPLDESLDLVRGYTPTLAKLVCKAAALDASYQEAGNTLSTFAGVDLDHRKFSHMGLDIVPELTHSRHPPRVRQCSTPPQMAPGPRSDAIC